MRIGRGLYPNLMIRLPICAMISQSGREALQVTFAGLFHSSRDRSYQMPFNQFEEGKLQ